MHMITPRAWLDKSSKKENGFGNIVQIQDSLRAAIS